MPENDLEKRGPIGPGPAHNPGRDEQPRNPYPGPERPPGAPGTPGQTGIPGMRTPTPGQPETGNKPSQDRLTEPENRAAQGQDNCGDEPRKA